MNTLTKLASVTLTALMLTTSFASAIEPVGGLNDMITPREFGPIGGGAEPGDPFNPNVSDAVVTTTDEALGDAVIDGQHAIPIDTAVLGQYGLPIDKSVLGSKGGKGKGQIRDGRALTLAFTCEAGGNELLTLSNEGDSVPAGTKLRWEVKSLGERGAVQLKTALGHGDQVRVDVGMDVDAGIPCAAKAI